MLRKARKALLTSVVVSLLVGTVSCSKPEPPAPPPELKAAGDAGVIELVVGDKRTELPAADFGAGKLPDVTRDDGSKRYRYTNQNGDIRLVYAIGDRLWLGPAVKGPVEALPKLESALGDLFVAAGPRQGELVADVQKSLGQSGVVLLLERALSAAEHADRDKADKEWDAAFAKLAPAQQTLVKAMLGKRLEPGGPTDGLRRAVVMVPLREASRVGSLESRVRELAKGGKELASAGVLLRALAALDGARAAKLGCEIVSKKEPSAPPGHDSLLDAAALAVASEVAKGAPLACDGLANALGEEACMPYFRCAAGKPVSFSQASDQNEPLCTKDEVKPVVASELDRAPAEVLAASPRAPLFAFAALTIADKLPDPFVQAHARRRFTLTQPKEPACDSGVALNTPCRCDEAMLRDLACRNLGASSAHVGLCKFEIDEKQKKIGNVSAALAQ